MTRAKRTDNNHAEIRDGLRALHYVVHDTSMYGAGFPDLVLDVAGQFVMFEVKSKGAELTEDELKFHAKFALCPVYVVYCLEDALKQIGEVMRC